MDKEENKEAFDKCEKEINFAVRYINKEVLPKLNKLVGPFEAMIAFKVIAESIENYMILREKIDKAHIEEIKGKINLNRYISLN